MDQLADTDEFRQLLEKEFPENAAEMDKSCYAAASF